VNTIKKLRVILLAIVIIVAVVGCDEVQGEQRKSKIDKRTYQMSFSLTDDERAYIESRPVIPFVAESDNYPISFFDVHNRQWYGIAHEVLQEIAELTGLTFVRVNEHNVEMPVLLRMLERGEAALITELCNSVKRQGGFLWSSTSMTNDYFALVSKTNFPYIAGHEVMEVRVGLVGNTIYEDIFRSIFPEHKNVVVYDNFDDLLASLERGDVNLMVSSTRRLVSLIYFYGMTEYKVNYMFNERVASRFGFNTNEEMLLDIIDKAFEFIDIEAIALPWEYTRTGYGEYSLRAKIRNLLSMIAILASFILLLLFLLFLKKLEEKRLGILVKQRTNELEELNEMYISASKAKSDFLSNMSHEIRTPLNAIVGMLSIGKNANETERKDYCFNKIEDASKQLLGVVNDVLDVAKIEAGKFELSLITFNFADMLTKIAEVMQHRADEKRQEYNVKIDEKIPKRLIGDDQRFTKVLTNLIGNAMKFTPEEGSISIKAKLVKEDENSCTIEVSVTDTGIGLSPEQQARVFDSFVQAEQSTTRNFGGTGLGLTISKNIIEMMKGRIWVESQLGKGAKFSFSVELAKTDEKDMTYVPELSCQENMKFDFEGFCVLLVEDMEVNREIFLSVLEHTKLKIDCAENGVQAVEMFKASPEKYDLILMDIQMPVMSGYEATRIIRKLGTQRAKEIPIIAMTANVFREDVEKYLACGMNCHIGKPIDIENVMHKLQKHLQSAKKY